MPSQTGAKETNRKPAWFLVGPLVERITCQACTATFPGSTGNHNSGDLIGAQLLLVDITNIHDTYRIQPSSLFAILTKC